MDRRAKIGWLYGLLAIAVSAFEPQSGFFLMFFTGLMLFILWCFDVNAKQRVKYYKEPEKLFKIGQNLPYAGQIHKLQLKIIPYTAKGIFYAENLIATLPLLFSVYIGVLLDIAQMNSIKKYEFYQSMALFKVIPRQYCFIIGIPLQIIVSLLLYLMARSFWKRTNYYSQQMDEKNSKIRDKVEL